MNGHGFRRNGAVALCFAGLIAAGVASAAAQSQQGGEPAPGPDAGNARAIFKFGFNSYRNGKKDEAFEAYRDAADHGHTGARWKLANMYAAGDGTPENDLEAFRLFEGIVKEGADPGTRESTYVANALVSLGNYLRRGIPETPIVPDAGKARDLYWQAAANFGEPNAQFELGRMFLMGEGGEEDPRQAARWFNLAAEKGHVGAEAMLGNMLFERGKHVRGLAMMTRALSRAQGEDRLWIRHLQEEAFAIASEADRRTAISLAEARTAQ